MAVQLARRPAAPHDPLRGDREATVYCPRCQTFETAWFANGRLMPAQKFRYRRGQVYHDCRTFRPCRLYHPR
jgi:hypothetical protein